jgi:hypothetical protein
MNGHSWFHGHFLVDFVLDISWWTLLDISLVEGWAL